MARSTFTQLPHLLVAGSVSVLLAACGTDTGLPSSGGDNNGGGDNGGGTPAQVETAVVNAATSTVYFNLIDKQAVGENDTWHVAFNRYNITLNDQVEGAIGDEQAEFYDAQGAPIASFFINADATDELNSLNAVTAAAGDFVGNGVKTAIDGSWLGQSGANTDNYWVIGSAEGNSFAKMRASAYIGATSEVVFEFYVEANGAGAFSDTAVTFTAPTRTDATLCFDFDAGTTVDCTTNTWDIKSTTRTATRSMVLTLNGGVSGDQNAKAIGPVAVDEYASGVGINPNAWQTDKEGSIFTDYTWWEYGVNDGHNLWSNYRVYVIDTDKNSDADDLIKLQMTSYYHPDTGASSNVNFRYVPISASGE